MQLGTASAPRIQSITFRQRHVFSTNTNAVAHSKKSDALSGLPARSRKARGSHTASARTMVHLSESVSSRFRNSPTISKEAATRLSPKLRTTKDEMPNSFSQPANRNV